MSAQVPEDAVGREEAYGAAEDKGTKAWERVTGGRFMPRRIRGSFHGRELG